MVEHFVAWWNVENLFDVENSPRRPESLRKRLAGELAGWNQEILDRKISQLSSIIMQMNDGKGPDILGVCEIENEWVMQLLVSALAPLGRDYRVAHHDTGDERGIDVAFVYDGAKFQFERQFQHIILKRSGTRDLFQVNLISASGRPLIVIGNHWPSRSGGVLESEPYRMTAGETLSYWNERIVEEKGDDTAVLIMGDFNDEPHDRSLIDYALSTHSLMKVKNARTPRLHNLMWTLMGKGLATFYYDYFPNMLDQFLVTKSMVKNNAPISFKPDSVRIESYPEMTADGDYPVPIPFGRPSKQLNRDGFSDHFPISVVLQEI